MRYQLRGHGSHIHLTEEKGQREDNKWPTTSVSTHPSSLLSLNWSSEFLRWNYSQSSSHLNSGQKRKEKTISLSLSCLSLSFLLFLLIFVILFYSLPSCALPPSHFSNLFLHFQFLPLPVYISSLHLQLIPPEELHELTSCLLDIFLIVNLISLEARY